MPERVFRGIGLVGSRALPEYFRAQVSGVVSCLIQRGYSVHSGGALGADSFVLDALLSLDACSQGVIFSPWASVSSFPVAVRSSIHRFIAYGGRVDWGCVSAGSARGVVIAGLLERNSRLVRASSGLVAFLYGESSGTRRTIAEAVRLGRRVIVFVCGSGASLPRQYGGSWVQLGGRSPLSGGYLFLPAISFDSAQDKDTAQREATMEGTRAVRVLQEVH
ncbi:MAG: DNA-processing protein DprA [Endomicrobiales bacterium]|nr:DNA-processing protein DprA [Endomicrobiales bacterium]